MAQDAPNSGVSSGAGVQLLMQDPADYNLAIDQALDIFNRDRPNTRVKDVTVAVAGFRFVLGGTGTVLPTSGADAWVDGASYLVAVYHPWAVTTQGAEPIDPNLWRVVDDPGGLTVLEFLAVQPAVADVFRLVYVSPHVVAAAAVDTSIRTGDQKAAIVISASMILQMAAIKAVQNTGNSGLPNDIVDRRSQSDQFRSRAKELREIYNGLVGKGTAADLQPQSGTKDLDVKAGTRNGFLWHPLSGH